MSRASTLCHAASSHISWVISSPDGTLLIIPLASPASNSMTLFSGETPVVPDSTLSLPSDIRASKSVAPDNQILCFGYEQSWGIPMKVLPQSLHSHKVCEELLRHSGNPLGHPTAKTKMASGQKGTWHSTGVPGSGYPDRSWVSPGNSHPPCWYPLGLWESLLIWERAAFFAI